MTHTPGYLSQKFSDYLKVPDERLLRHLDSAVRNPGMTHNREAESYAIITKYWY